MCFVTDRGQLREEFTFPHLPFTFTCTIYIYHLLIASAFTVNAKSVLRGGGVLAVLLLKPSPPYSGSCLLYVVIVNKKRHQEKKSLAKITTQVSYCEPQCCCHGALRYCEYCPNQRPGPHHPSISIQQLYNIPGLGYLSRL